jgi:GH24 family phage-related lysozyme (muramidase)
MNRADVFEQLILDEGIRHEIYLDHLGYPTFGVGHLIVPSDPEYGAEIGSPVSEERVWEAFNQDLDDAISECKVLYPMWDGFPEEVKQILVNMMFNMGRPNLSKFRKMNEHLASRNWKDAATEGRDSLWYRQVPNRAERLMSRLEVV